MSRYIVYVNVAIVVWMAAFALSCKDEEAYYKPPPVPTVGVYQGSMTLTTQRQVDVFSFTDIKGWLNIVGPDIRDLSPLRTLVNVNKEIVIEGTSVTSLDGLNNVTIIPVQYGGNTVFDTSLKITNNPNLESLGNLSKISFIGRLEIINNDQLRNIDGFTALTEFTGTYLNRYSTQLTVADNDNLENIDGLTNVRIFRNTSFEIKDNPSLGNLNGLTNSSMENEDDNHLLSNSPSECRVSGNSKLTDFCGLSQLVASADYYSFVFETNGFSITRDDIVNGNCAQ